jgi:hypothetical protein
MRKLSFVWLVPMVLVATASISSSGLTPQAPSATPQEPTTLGEFSRIDPATGTPTEMERVKVKNLKVGHTREPGILQPREDLVDLYVEGVASPVVFKAGESQQFVIRMMSPGDRYGRELNSAELLKHVGLMQLVVQNIKKHDERFLTKSNIPLDVQPYGQLTHGLDPKQPDRVAQSFRLTPSIALTPGEYLIWIKATHNFELIANGLVGDDYWAFEIVKR